MKQNIVLFFKFIPFGLLYILSAFILGSLCWTANQPLEIGAWLVFSIALTGLVAGVVSGLSAGKTNFIFSYMFFTTGFNLAWYMPTSPVDLRLIYLISSIVLLMAMFVGNQAMRWRKI